MAGFLDSVGNLISGGTWQQSGGELKAQEFNAAQAQLERDFNSAEAQKTRDFEREMFGITSAYNASEAQKQRDFEREMSNTAYSRAVADARSVGINPYALSIGGASTPTGATASMSTPNSAQASAGSGARGTHTSSNVDGQVVTSALNIVGAVLGSRLGNAKKPITGFGR